MSNDDDDDFVLAPDMRRAGELAHAWAWLSLRARTEAGSDSDAGPAGFGVAFQLGLLADLEALAEVKPLPGMDAGRLKRPGSLPYRVAVAEAGLDNPSDSAVDVAVVADRIRDELRAFLGKRGLLETEEVAVSGLAFNGAVEPPVSRRYPVGSRVERRIPPGAFVVRADDGRWATRMRGDLIEADALLAELLEELGAKEDASHIRTGGLQTPPWRRWNDGAESGLVPAVMAMVRAVWARVKDERERARLAHGVMGRRAFKALQHTVRVGANRPELVDIAEGVAELQLARGVKVATVPSSLVQGLTQERLDSALRGAGLLATAGWNALLHKSAVSSSLRQWNGEQHPGLYRFAGYAGLADALGLSSPKHRQALPDMLEFGECYRFDLGDGFEPAALWSHRVEKVGGEGQGRRLEWNVNPWAYGADVRSLPDDADKALVFLSPQPAPMVLKASPNLSAAQWSFWWQFHAALMLRRAELFDTGAMTLDASWWESVAEAAGWSEKQKRELLPLSLIHI